MLYKKCSVCKEDKPSGSFPKNRRNRDGLHTSCKACHRAASKKRYWENRDTLLQKAKDYYRNNKEAKKAYDKEWYLKNKDRKHKSNKKWNDRNREQINKVISKWKKDNPEKVRAYTNKRRAKQLQALPEWITSDQLKEIENFYWLAKDLYCITGEEYHVDHIIPLQGEDVCGLHVPWNLQILPADLNIKKGVSHGRECISSAMSLC